MLHLNGSTCMLRPWDLQITINTNCDRPVYIQIADAIISEIKSGKLRGGDALPGSRQLAAKLDLNRNTIVEALDMLLSEGWLVSKARKGIFIAEQLHGLEGRERNQSPETTSRKKPDIVFDDGLPDSRIAPIKELAAAYRQIFNQKGRRQLMGYGTSASDHEFREAIAQMLNFKRGMRLSANQIFITRGSQMATYLSAHCLVERGDYILVENPGYRPAWLAFQNAGAKLLPIRVDSEGIVVEEIKAHLRSRKKIKAIYLTPHHQFPTTVTLSLPRRQELVALSNQYGFTIIEDDYDNEFHFEQRTIFPLSSFQSLENYVYIGTMSKIISPALRIGYLASSESFLQTVGQLRKIIDVQGDSMMEQAILHLINDGHMKRHLRRATVLYKNRRDFFANAINRHLGDKVLFTKPDGGLAFWLVPKKRIELMAAHRQLLQKGIQLLSPQDFSFNNPINGLRLGYASLTESQVDEGLGWLGKFL